ncbi:hypothetical protein BX667DRAFT_495154 [Coemansia mojavensis]|nr:hypothetical protein BX667DRAFT_495154 [Coemansia mojavensis]
MRRTAKLSVAAVLAVAANAVAMPQYGPQGMGGYGYPMGGPMMNGPMNGPMMGPMGPYGMGNQYNGPMYMPPNPRFSHMRGQRYHAHASPDEWPMPANPYMGARNRRNAPYFASNEMYNYGEMRASGHNRVPSDDVDSDDEDKKEQSSEDTGSTAAGVNRMAVGDSQTASCEQPDNNTSLDMASLGSKVINVSDFDGASIKPCTSTAASETASATVASADVDASSSTPCRHTLTRHLPAATPAAASQSKKQPAKATPKPAAHTCTSATSSVAKSQSAAATPVKAASHACSHSTATPAVATPQSAAATPKPAASHKCPAHSTAATPKPVASHPCTAHAAASSIVAAKPVAATPTAYANACSAHATNHIPAVKPLPAAQIRTPGCQTHRSDQTTAHVKAAHTDAAKHEPSMKNIRGI